MNLIAPLSENQYRWYLKALEPDNWFNVSEGGKRAGKNVMGVLAFCTLLEMHPNKLHLIAGVSIATAKLNIVDCDGFGITNFFSGRCREGEYKNRDCLYIATKTGEKIVLISGGGKNGDEKNIKGNTYGMAYITEANECHKNFIKEVFDRTLSSDMRKVIHDLNPKSPTHEYYTEVLNFHEEQQKNDSTYGLNYGHFTIVDNNSITDDKLRQVLKTYNKNDLWYKRDILGQRIQAEGLIYGQFAEDNDDYIIDEIPDDYRIDFIRYGVDFGGSGSATAFVATAICNYYHDIIPVRAKRIEKELSPDMLEKEFNEFVQEVYDKYKIFGETRADSAEQILIRGMKRSTEVNGIPTVIRNAKKMPILDRIRLFVKLISLKRFKVLKCCKTVIKALNTAVWNEKVADERLDNGTTDIDTLDSLEYSVEPDYKYLIDNI